MHSLLVAPLDPALPGNGLAQRCSMWHDVLAGMGAVTMVIAPVAGPAGDHPDAVVVAPAGTPSPLVPRLARGLTHELGLAVAHDLDTHDTGVDLIVGVRSYTGLLCGGLRAATGARLLVDLDDDDVTFYRSTGDEAEAVRFEQLVHRVTELADVVVSAQGFAATLAVPNSVPVPSSPGRAPHATPTALFLGNMGYQPNRDAATWLLDEIAPLVARVRPDIDVRVAGPGSEVFGAAGMGLVDDLGGLLASVDVLVAPIRSGSGTRIKILDAWAHGLPVVSTTIGAEGLGAVDGAHLLVADDAQTLAACVVRVIESPSLAADLSSAGRRLVEQRYGRDGVVAAARALLPRAQPGRPVAALVPTLETTETEDGLVVLETLGGTVHELDHSASVVLSLIDGVATDDDLAQHIQSLYGMETAPLDAVHAAVADLVRRGLVVRRRPAIATADR